MYNKNGLITVDFVSPLLIKRGATGGGGWGGGAGGGGAGEGNKKPVFVFIREGSFFSAGGCINITCKASSAEAKSKVPDCGIKSTLE
jgi:hypothetical protein